MSDSSDEDGVSTPVALREPVQNAELSFLPEKSRSKYMHAYDTFNTWRYKNGEETFTESVLLAYFDDLAKSMKPSTLWSIFSMLKATLKLKKDVHIENYPKLLAFIKRTSSGHKPQKSKIFTAADIAKFLNEAPDSDHLSTKVVLIIGISGACRTKELTHLKTSNVEQHSEKLLLFKLPDTKTNNERNFVVCDEYVEVIKKYQNLRPPKTSTDRFFLAYRKGKCINQPMGPNKIGSLPREIATFLGLSSPEQYTGHCLRRTSATLLGDSGGDLTALKRQGGWYSSVTEGLEDSIGNKSKIGTDTNLSNLEPGDPLTLEQCRFCGEFTKDCVEVTSQKPYLANNRTSIALNSLSVDLDFNDTLPKSVCRHCDEKLQELHDFVKQVKAAQDRLIHVAEEGRADIETLIIKTESPTPEEDTKEGILDSVTVTVGETEYTEHAVFTHKRKIEVDSAGGKKQKQPVAKEVTAKKQKKTVIGEESESNELKQKPKVAKEVTARKQKKTVIQEESESNELIADIKEEVIDVQMENSRVSESDTGTGVGPSELDLATSALLSDMAGYL